METMGPISEVRAKLRHVVNTVGRMRKRDVITRQGKPVAVIISPEELEGLEMMADSDLLKSLLRAEAEKKLWQEKEKGWQRFHEWEKGRTDYVDHQSNLRMIGDKVDFFRQRHPQYSKKTDVSGIRTMHKRLSKISKLL